jgi:hypothetical protein
MLSSISPLGERARHQRFWLTALAYLATSVAAGAAVGAAIGAIGSALPDISASIALVVLAIGSVVGLLADRGRLGLRVPGPHRQVNEDWLARYRGWVYGGGFGLQLGAAFTTIVPSSITYLAFGCALLSGSVGAGALIGAIFGLARALPIYATARVQDWGELRAFMGDLQQRFASVRRAVIVTQIGVAGAAIGWAAA